MMRPVLSRKGLAEPPPEPALRCRENPGQRRVGAHLPTELYVAFKAYVARSGSSGEEVIGQAIAKLIGVQHPDALGDRERPPARR